MSKILYKISEFVLLFIISSFVGWLYEISCVYVLYGTYYDRGVLHLPLCPIYGFGVLLLYAIFHKVKNIIVIFVSSVLVTTLIELVTSYIAEIYFHLILWTYEDWPFNFQNRISLISSLIFGLMSIIFFYIIRPFVNKLFISKYYRIIFVFTVILVVFLLFIELSL